MLTVRTIAQPTYRVICVGANNCPGAPVLRFAEKDATDIAKLLCGEVGPVDPEDVILLKGASRRAMRVALESIRGEAPEFLLFYFSGHGSHSGIALRDGTFSYLELAQWLRAINADSSVTVLDTCYSGAFIKRAGKTALGAVDEDVLQLLASATPGNRVICSSAADRRSGEGGGVPNGHLTAALIEAVLQAPGDLSGAAACWISARRLFARAESTLIRQWQQRPVAYGLRGDFPVTRDHGVMFGSAELAGLDVLGSSIQVSVALADRRGVPTLVRAEAYNRQGRRLYCSQRLVSTGKAIEVFSVPFTFNSDALMKDPASQIHLLMRNKAPVTWRVAVLDCRRRVLDHAEQLVWYSNGSPRRAFAYPYIAA